jgi:sigma-E factor negative regulatory protein RseC
MPTEQGIVTKVESTTAWVTTKKTDACNSCGAKSACHVVGGGKEMEVEAINNAGAKVGQKVVLSFETSPLLRATFLLYVFPILVLLGGALIGDKMAPRFGFDASIFSAIIGFFFFGISILFVRSMGNKMAKKDAYRPKVMKILP